MKRGKGKQSLEEQSEGTTQPAWTQTFPLAPVMTQISVFQKQSHSHMTLFYHPTAKGTCSYQKGTTLSFFPFLLCSGSSLITRQHSQLPALQKRRAEEQDFGLALGDLSSKASTTTDFLLFLLASENVLKPAPIFKFNFKVQEKKLREMHFSSLTCRYCQGYISNFEKSTDFRKIIHSISFTSAEL